MPLSVLPVQPSYGSGSSVEFDELMRMYADLSYRRYLKSTAAHEMRSLTFDELSQTEYNSLKSFFIARKQATTGGDDKFVVYDSDVVNAPDTSGTSLTGKHTAIFLDSKIEFTRDGPCSWSGSLNVLFLD